nr:MJ0042-type zinc finger domain-containing protein [Rickettsia endosymbiont of Ceutorhynchus assimilis]
MYITCPNCQTKFTVFNEQIGINGRKVKCSKCRHIWHQKLDYNATKLTDFAKIEETPEAITTPFKNEFYTEGSGLPALLPRKPPNYSFFSLLWISFIIFSSIILLEDNCRFLVRYDQLKIDHIVIQDIKNPDRIKISYAVTNPSSYQISNLIFRVRIIDKNRKILDSYVTNKMNINILPDQTINMAIELDGLPPFAEYLDITIGNKFDFLFK